MSRAMVSAYFDMIESQVTFLNDVYDRDLHTVMDRQLKNSTHNFDKVLLRKYYSDPERYLEPLFEEWIRLEYERLLKKLVTTLSHEQFDGVCL